jgi:threonine dehydratase
MTTSSQGRINEHKERAAADLPIPTLADIFAAKQIVDRFLKPTPLLHSIALSEQLGFDLYLKCENLQPVGAFKVRGGIYLMSQLEPEYRATGVVTASTGNHGQSIAYAAREFGVQATIYMPKQANPVKVASMRRLGAEIVFHGKDFDEGRQQAEIDAAATGRYFIQSANDDRLVTGVGTYTLEIMQDLPRLDVLFVPVGAGSGVCGGLIAGKGVNPSLTVYGVQAEGAAVVADSWRDRALHQYASTDTFAEGLATRVAFEYPARIMWDRIDGFVLVSDDEMRAAMLSLMESAWIVAEGAGAAATAAAFKKRAELQGKTVCCVVSGGNVPLAGLRDALARGTAGGAIR